MPSTIFSGSDVKTLKDNLSLNDKAKILPSNGSPAAGAGLAAPIGSLALDYTNGKTYKKIGALDTDWSELGSGVGGINYITNTDAGSGTAGWSTYADAAGAQPVDGTGGTPNVTWTRSTTTPLRGTADFNFVKDAADRQGQGVSTDMTINLADQAKVLTVSFDYEVLSGTYATGDLTVYLIQDPAGTPVVIQPAGYQILSATAGTKMKQIATFQTASSGQTYRLCFHVASTSASAYTLAIDNVIVGPQVVQYGAPVTDWQSYSLLISATTTNPTIPTSGVTNNTALFRRIGDSAEIFFCFETGTVSGGNNGSGTYLFSLPPGLSIDTTKFPAAGAVNKPFGQARIGTDRDALIGYVPTVSTNKLIISYESSGISLNALSSADSLMTTNSISIMFMAKVPILGWSSTVQMSNDTDTRVVAASATRATTQSLTANVTDVVMTTSVFDTHGAYNTSTGAYVAPVSGYYSIGGVLSITVANSCSFVAYVDASSRVALGSISNSVGFPLSGVVYLNAGQSLTIRADTTVTLNNVRNAISINRLSGPSAIAASETVAFSGTNTAGTAITGATITKIPFPTIQINTHGSFVTDTFTVPSSGLYQVDGQLLFVAGGSLNTGTVQVYIYKNGSSIAQGFSVAFGSTIIHSAKTSILIRCVAGDTLDLRGRITNTGTLDTTVGVNLFNISRVGN